MRSDCIVSSVMRSDCIVDVSESASQGNTVEMFSAPTITEDSKSYTTYDRRSIEDFDYRPYDVSTHTRIHTHTHVDVNTRNVETYLHTQTYTLSHKHVHTDILTFLHCLDALKVFIQDFLQALHLHDDAICCRTKWIKNRLFVMPQSQSMLV